MTRDWRAALLDLALVHPHSCLHQLKTLLNATFSLSTDSCVWCCFSLIFLLVTYLILIKDKIASFFFPSLFLYSTSSAEGKKNITWRKMARFIYILLLKTMKGREKIAGENENQNLFLVKFMIYILLYCPFMYLLLLLKLRIYRLGRSHLF